VTTCSRPTTACWPAIAAPPAAEASSSPRTVRAAASPAPAPALDHADRGHCHCGAGQPGHRQRPAPARPEPDAVDQQRTGGLPGDHADREQRDADHRPGRGAHRDQERAAEPGQVRPPGQPAG
jgi:hypothetical protein